MVSSSGSTPWLLALTLLLSAPLSVHSISVTSGSPCTAYCQGTSATATKDTTIYDVTCLDSRYATSVASLRWQNCLSCLVNSTYTSGSENDQSWFFYNMRYAVSTCLFKFDNASGLSSNPCATATNCGSLQSSFEDGNLDPKSVSEYGYCSANNNAMKGTGADKCIQCLSSTANDTVILSNYVSALSVACSQQPKSGNTLILNGTVFATSPIGAGSTSSGSSGVHLSTLMIAIIVLVILVALTLTSAIAFYIYRRRKASPARRAAAKRESGDLTGWDQPALTGAASSVKSPSKTHSKGNSGGSGKGGFAGLGAAFAAARSHAPRPDSDLSFACAAGPGESRFLQEPARPGSSSTGIGGSTIVGSNSGRALSPLRAQHGWGSPRAILESSSSEDEKKRNKKNERGQWGSKRGMNMNWRESKEGRVKLEKKNKKKSQTELRQSAFRKTYLERPVNLGFGLGSSVDAASNKATTTAAPAVPRSPPVVKPPAAPKAPAAELPAMPSLPANVHHNQNRNQASNPTSTVTSPNPEHYHLTPTSSGSTHSGQAALLANGHGGGGGGDDDDLHVAPLQPANYHVNARAMQTMSMRSSVYSVDSNAPVTIDGAVAGVPMPSPPLREGYGWYR